MNPEAADARGRPATLVVLTAKERSTLERWARRMKGARALAQRARIVLACSAGEPNGSIAAAAGITRLTVGRWRRRFASQRLQGLLDEPRPGAPRRITDAKIARVVRLARTITPPGVPRWSTRTLARRCGLSQTAVSRILRALTPKI